MGNCCAATPSRSGGLGGPAGKAPLKRPPQPVVVEEKYPQEKSLEVMRAERKERIENLGIFRTESFLELKHGVQKLATMKD